MPCDLIKKTEQKIKQSLAAAYRLLAYFKMDDLTYTHLSARTPEEDAFFISPFGLLFEEITASSLLKVDFQGRLLEGTEEQYNQTGYVIHSSLYQKRPDLQAVFHLHTPAGVAVSSMKCGLLPLSQFSFHFYGKISCHPYQGLALAYDKQGKSLQEDLGSHKVMLLQNHGTLACGTSIPEAFFYAYYLEQACKVQCMALQAGQELVYPSPSLCAQTSREMRDFETDLGARDWKALLRLLEKIAPDYKL